MLKFTNLKKLTYYSLIAAAIGGILISQPVIAGKGNGKGNGNGNGNGNGSQSCKSNNGHGNNADIPLTLSTGTTLTITQFDPSNPGNGDYITKRINAANSNLSPTEILEAKNQLQQLIYDVELRGRSSDGSDCGTNSTNNETEDTKNTAVIPEVGGSNACVLDWSEVLRADPDGWITSGGSDGTRNDLHRVYYHEPSGKYVKVSVDQRWDWGGARDSPRDAYPYSPKIVDYSKWGTGGFDGEDMFLFSLKTKRGQDNRLTIEFFNDSHLASKADISKLNFTLTDLDGTSKGEARENIVVSAKNSLGSTVPINFYRPQGSVIEDSWINGGSVLGKEDNVTDAKGNIAPVLLEDTHKVEIKYQLAPNSREKEQVRHMYVSDLAWCGETVKVTPDEEVDPDKITNPNPTFAD